MPGPVSHGGWRRHVRICRCAHDAAYGAVPGAPDWVWVPLLGDGMKTKATAPRYVPPTNYSADFRRHVAIHDRLVVGGTITTLLWPEIGDYLLDMALDRNAVPASPIYQDLSQYVIEHHTPPDPRRNRGCVCNRLTLTATGTGDNDVQVALDMLGRDEVEVGLEVPDYSGITPAPFMFGHAEIQIDSIHVMDIEQFTLTVENNISEAPFVYVDALGVAVRAHAIANQRVISLALTELNNDDRFNQAIRAGHDVTFQALFRHPNHDIFQLILPSCYIEESEENGDPTVQAKESPTLQARVAESGTYEGEDIVYGVDVGPATTTLAEVTTTLEEATTTTAGE